MAFRQKLIPSQWHKRTPYISHIQYHIPHWASLICLRILIYCILVILLFCINGNGIRRTDGSNICIYLYLYSFFLFQLFFFRSFRFFICAVVICPFAIGWICLNPTFISHISHGISCSTHYTKSRRTTTENDRRKRKTPTTNELMDFSDAWFKFICWSIHHSHTHTHTIFQLITTLNENCATNIWIITITQWSCSMFSALQWIRQIRVDGNASDVLLSVLSAAGGLFIHWVWHMWNGIFLLKLSSKIETKHNHTH